MGVGRNSSYRIRERYAKALKAIPLPIRTLSGVDPQALVNVGETELAGRRIVFAVLPGSPRLWITVPDLLPPVIGYASGFDTRRLDLHLTELDHIDWAAGPGRVTALKRAAHEAWAAAQRDCEG
ncbi:hypothetical protein [Glycomyces paridis]|uniref:Uncharacterized protein n=1 Tax=Glycomyces paridis TaxID=2126555 RepID=A0A4S8PJN6_9ACTN|nr:hypothetical protein [Glycomyces paridis]THV30211.1 hypothetical protein E9998_07520 [Glycomyces paridis]